MLRYFIVFGMAFCMACNPASGKKEIKEYDLIEHPGTETKTVIQFDSLGNKKIEGNIIKGKKNGMWVTYGKTGQIIDITNYIEDKKQGPYIKYTTDNRISEQGSYVNDILEGKMIKFLHGHIDEVIDFKNGLKHGWAKKHYLGGGVQMEMEMVHDVQNGVYRFYGEKGELQIEEIFKDGKKISGGIVKK